MGSEPTGLALSPTGRFLAVAEWAEGRLSIIDTTSNTVVSSIGVRNPRAVAISNNGDGNDADETVVVTEFYGRTNSNREATDNSRNGVVRTFSIDATGALTDTNPITFAPGADGGFGVGYSPNQLFGVAIQNGRIYVPNIAASPAGPPAFDRNVNPVILVADLATRTEVTGGLGSQSLAPMVAAFLNAPRFFLADLVDVSFLASTNIGYAVARGAEVMQRLDYNTTTGQLAIGSSQNQQIDLTGNATIGNCFNPTGVVVSAARSQAFVNCWGSQRLGVVALASQSLLETVVSVPAPSTAPELSVNRGRHFFFTGRGRWSNNAWSSCGSCHPDGLSDNMTWIFGAGPRQSTSMDGSFSHGQGTQKQRIFNWSGIIDEIHDFESNIRGTQGGKGVVTTAGQQSDCGNLALEFQVGAGGVVDAGLPAGLVQSMKEIADNITIKCAANQWDDIDNYAKTIRPPRARTQLDPAAVMRGSVAFDTCGCANCHGGAGWTVSRRFYTPSNTTITTVTNTPFVKPALWPTTWTFHNTNQIATQPAAAEVAGFNSSPIAPPQVACAIRNIGTFGVPGDVAATDVLEVKPGTRGRAQGRGGYNVPSLYGMQVAAPLLHHGQAASVSELFTDAKWDGHTNAGNANCKVLLDTTAGMRSDLVQYIWSIDATTAEKPIPAGFDTGCAP